jgi:hypothetical protein
MHHFEQFRLFVFPPNSALTSLPQLPASIFVVIPRKLPYVWAITEEETQMRLIRTVIATPLVVSLAFLGYAWGVPWPDAARTTGEPMKSHEASSVAQQDQAKPPKETPFPKETPPPKQASPPKQAPPPPRETPEARPPKTEKEQQKKQKEKSKQEQKQQKQPSGKSARIPDNQLKAHFGRPHTFAAKQVITTTTIVPNQTQFVYVGYTFIFVDPWPTDWLLTDDCYIDYVDDEYFLLDVFHPGIRVALIIAG